MRRCVLVPLAVGGLLALMTPTAPTSAAGAGGHMSGAPVIRGTGLAHHAFTAADRAGSSKPSVADVRFRERDYNLSVDQRTVGMTV